MGKRELYPIGKAAEICKVSPRALRYYEEKGLIRPDEVSSSRYRYYSAETLLLVQLVRYYIDEGFSLQEARELLSRKSFGTLESYFESQIEKTREEIRHQHQRLDSMSAWHDLICEARQVLRYHDDSVTITSIPTLTYFYMDAEADLGDAHFTSQIETDYFSHSKDNGHTMVDVGGSFYIYYSSIGERISQSVMSVRLMQTLYPHAQSLHDTVEVDGYQAVSTYHIGPLDSIGKSYERAIGWAREHRFPLRQDSYERYVLDICSTDDENKFVTQILLPMNETEIISS